MTKPNLLRRPKQLTVIAAILVAALVVGFLLVKLASPTASGASTATCEPSRIDDSAKADTSDLGSPDGIAIVAANTASNPMPSLGDKAQVALAHFVKSTKRQPHLISAAVGADPITYRWTDISETGTPAGNQTRAEGNVRALAKALATPPKSSGLDMFEALARAVDQLKSEGSRRPLVVMVGSGLGDSGAMSTTKGLLNDDPAMVANRIAKENPGVSLQGVTVLAQSLGYTVGPQEAPTATQRAVISDMWNAILTKLGAKVVLDPNPGRDCSITTDKTVVPTDLPGAHVVECNAGTLDYELPASLLFGGDSAKLRAGAADTLADPIKILRENPKNTVELVGHTASSRAYTRAELIKLSTDRAKAVGRVLRKAGIDAARIGARGVGDTQPKHEDLNPDGTQNEYAAGERRVDLRIVGVTSCPAS